MRLPIAVMALALTFAACSQAPQPVPDSAQSPAAAAPSASEAMAPPTPTASNSADPAVLTLDGLGELRLDQAVPADSRWAERGAQASDTCRTVTSPDYPGVYAIVEGGKVRRITVGQRSPVELVEGIGVGASEAQVSAAFAGFRATPHKYVDAPAKYLTAPSGEPALRFEIGEDRKVSLIQVGMKPQLEYVEGCA